MKWLRVQIIVGGVVLLAAACSSGSDGVAVDDAWGRTSPNAVANAAFYMTLTGGEVDDVLSAAEADMCTVTELHETMMSNGVMQMQHLPNGIDIGAHETVLFEPGGKHIMCIGKKTDFAAGESLSVTLSFDTADDMVVEFEIRNE